MKWWIVVGGILCNASASILIKVALLPRPRPLTLADPWSIAANPPLIAGIGLYGTAFVLYAAALARLPLNVAHPILTSGAIALVAIASVIVFREPMPLQTLAGIALVAVGVALIASRVT